MIKTVLGSAAAYLAATTSAFAHPASEAHGPLPELHGHLIGVEFNFAGAIVAGVVIVALALTGARRRRDRR